MSKRTHNFLDRCRVVLDSSQQVCVKEVHTSGCFYLQLLETDDAYKLDEMYSRLEREGGRLPWKKYTPRLGEIILSYSTVRATLCRSEVVSLLGYYNQVRVFHVDYGSYESISLSHISSLPSHALQPTRQAVKCCLSDATCLTPEGLDTLRALSLEKELEGKLQWSYDLICYYATLVQQSGKASIGGLLISQGMATPLVRCNVLEPGLEFSCHLSTVVSPSELYFRFSADLQTLKDLQEMINSSRLSPFKSMAPLSDKLTREGAYCLIKNPADLLKYRARVICVRPSDRTAQVHLVDFGHKINVTYEQLFRMTPDTADQTALCFTSSLSLRPHSLAWGLEARERLLSLGQKYGMHFEVCVKNRIGTVHWLQVFTPDSNEPIEDSLSDLCVVENNYYLSMYRSPYGLSLEVNDSETVCITHVVDWNKFFVQLTKHSGELDWLTERLADSFSDTELDEQWMRSPTEGVLCAAPYYEANTWARAVVTSVPYSTTDKVQLFYIDYGNKDEVLPYDLKIIPTFAMHYPAMAIECGLYSTKRMPTYNLEDFRWLVAQKALCMTVHETNADRYLVSLVDKMAGGTDILESLELRSLSPASSLSPPPPTCTSPPLSPVAIPMRSLPLNSVIRIICTLADSPNNFKCQLLSRTETSLSSLTKTLQQVARDTALRLNTRDISLGMPVIAYNTKECLWYRAVILKKEQRGFTVDLVDFGNKIKIQAHEMTHLPVQLIAIPAFGITCKINLDIPLKWSDEDCNVFKSIILGKTFKAVLKSVQKRLYGIDICEQDILTKLKSIGIDTKKPKHNCGPKHFLNSLKLKAGFESRVLITHVDHPGRFFCQLEDNVAMYTEFQQYLSRTEISPEQAYFEEGDYCIALYVMTNAFYRARILSIDYTHHTADIINVDFGNREIASFDSLRTIPEKFTQLPMQAICCSLWGVHPIGTLEKGGWHSDSKPLMEKLFDSDYTLVKFQEVEYDNFLVSKAAVEILEPLGLVEKLVNEGFAITTRKQDIPTFSAQEGSIIKVVVSHLTPEHLVYCIPSAHGSLIDQLVADLESCESHTPLLSPKIGGVVAAKSPSSGLWNRARILSRIGKLKCEVTYIDIGTKEIIEIVNIRLLPLYAATIPCQTFPSTIPELDDYITAPNYVEVFRGLAGGGTLLCEICSVAVDDLYNISLKLPGGENLVDELVNQGALFKKHNANSDSICPPYSSISTQQGEGYPLSNQIIPTVVSQMSISLQSTCDVLVSHLDNPSNFYVQFMNSHAQLQFLSDQINQHYSSLTELELSKITPKNIVPGAVCCTRFAQDSLWYRGKVLEIDQNEVTVQYVDYGNTETKSINEIKLMHPTFYTLPGQAIKCSLVEVPKQDDWTMEASQLFQSLTFNKLLQCTFLNKSEDGIFLVSLIDSQSNLNIAQILLNSRYAKPTRSPVTDKKSIQDLEIKVNAQESVYISDIKTPENFHLHLSSYENNLNQFMDQITSHYNHLHSEMSVRSPTVGEVYCVKFLDHNWYRGIVREVKGNNLFVYMVDYGNLFNVALKDCKELHETFYTFPKHSIECCLHDVTLGATYTDWLPAAINFFKGQTEKQQLIAKFIQKNSEGRWEVTLTKGTRDIGKLICESGMAISKSFAARYASQTPTDNFSPIATTPTHSIANDVHSGQPHNYASNQGSQYSNRSPRKVKEIILPRGHVCETYVSFAISPTDFSIQLTELSDKLDALMEELARHCEVSYNEQVTRVTPQLLVAAKFTEDDKWYRAVITNADTPGVVKVHYIDYGNKENLDMGRIRPLPNQLSGLQAQAIKCSLRGFSKETRFSPELMDQFKQTVTDRFFTLQVLNFHSSYYEVDLVDNASTQSMAAVFLSKSSGQTQVFVGELKPLILSEGTELTAQLCIMHSPTDFYMQVAETSEALNSMEFELNRTSVAGKAPKSFELKVGVPCAACYSTSGTWYRAKVLAVSSPKIHVLYVDYGNDEWLLNEKIQPLPQKFLSLPCQAFRCAIRSQQSRHMDEDVDKFRDKLTAARDIRVKIIGHHDKYIYLVELYAHQTNEALKYTSSRLVIYPTLQIPVGTVDLFKICHILPNGTFYLQRDSAEATLNSISTDLAAYANRIQLGMKAEDLQPGLPCAVKFYQDTNWYRGKVLRAPQQQHVEIQFVDYGNDDVISIHTLISIPDVHLTLPVQAIQAMLQSNVDIAVKPSIKGLENFQAKTHEQVLKVNIVSKNSDLHIVRLFFSNDEEIFMSGPESKPPGFRKGRPGEENSSGNESSKFGGRFENARLSSAPSPRDSSWRDREDEHGQRGERSEGGFKNRGEEGYGRKFDREGGFEGRSDRREGGFSGRNDREGGFSGRNDREGGFGGRNDREGGFSGRNERREGGFGGRNDREGGFSGRNERREGGFSGKNEREGGFSGRNEREGGFSGRNERREGGFSGRNEREGGFGGRNDREGGFSGRNDREGGFGGRNEREGGFGGRSDRREGGFGDRSDKEGGFKGRSDRGEGGYRERDDREDRNQRGDRKFEPKERGERNYGERRERNFGERSNRPNTSDQGERRDRSEGWNRSGGGEKSEKLGDEDTGNKFGTSADAWKGSEDIRLKDVLGTQGWAKNAESKPETVHWDTKPEAKPTDSFIEERLVINQAYEVYISYIVSSKEFYCSLTHKSDNLEAVMKKLSNLGAAESLTAVTANAMQPGKAVVSLFSEDNCLYRARLLSAPQDGSVEVQYVDYGNSQKVTVANLKTIPTELLELPSQAIPCMLPQEVDKFRENIEAHESVKIKVTNVDGEKTTVDIFTTDGKIIYKMKPSQVGKKMEVYFSHVISPYEFYCQSTNTTTLDTINNLLAEFTNTVPLGRQEMKLGQMCLGVYSIDSALYRSIIIQIIDPKSKVLVQFMDYGNSEEIHPSKIHQMPSNISSFPTQAYKCAVVHPTYKIAEEKVAQFVREMNGNDKVVIDVKEAALNQYLLVEILDTCGKPIPLPFAVPTSASIADPPIYPPGAGIKCGISHVVNPSEFYCQSLSIINTLEQLMNNIENDVTNNLLAKLKSYGVGNQCIAQFSVDSGWYRGVIVNQVDAYSYQVLFIDYGNREAVSNKNMYSPKPDYLAIPPCAFQCSIVVDRAIDGWNEAIIDEFSNKIMHDSVIIQIIEVTADTKYKVKLLDEFGIEEIALPEIKPTSVTQEKYDPIPIPENSINIYISSINSVHLFYVQQSNCEENLATLMEKLNQVCTSGSCTTPNNWFVGMICFARFSDGVWYRSRIDEVTDDQVMVNYIDYGNSQLVSKTDVLSINKDLLQMPFALPCRFAGGYGIKSTAEIEAKFAEYAADPLELCVVGKGFDGIFECQLNTQVDSTDDPVDIGNELAELIPEETRCNEIMSYCERTATSLTQQALATAVSVLSEPRISHFQRSCLPVASTHSVYLTQTDAQLALLYIQLSDSDAAIQALTQDITQFCADTNNLVKLDCYRVGTPCLTKFTEDNLWYRAEVTETFLEFDHVKVLFIDYGNTPVSHVDSVIRISPDLLKVPAFTYLCKLDACYLIPEGFDISSTLSGYEIESLLEIEVTQVESCVHYVKLTDPSAEESQDIGQVISNEVPYDTKQALLSDKQTSFVNNLVDELIHNVISKLDIEKKHNENSLLLDSYVNEYVECIIQTSQNKLELEEDTAINQLVNDVINTSTNHVVRIHQGYKTQPLADNTKISVNLSHIVSTQCFYVQVLSQAVDLFQVTEEVESYCSDSANTVALNCVAVDLPVLAVFSQDSAWYRGIVTAVCDAQNAFKILFVDFGNSDDVPGNLICHLPDQLLSKVSFSYQCRLSSEYKIKDDASSIAKFTELTEMKTDLLMEVIGFSEGVYEVRLFEGFEGEVGILMNTLPFFYPDPNDPPNPVTLTCFNSHHSFYLQTQPNQNSLQDLQTQMLDYCSSSTGTAVQMDQLLPGTLVLVFLDYAQSWNRAKILANSEFSQETQVQLIDYGSVLLVCTSQIRLLSPSSPITTLPPIAFHCRLPPHYCILPCGPVSEEFVKPRAATATFNGPIPPNNQFEAEVFDGEQRLAVFLEKLSDPYRKWQYVFPPIDTLKNVFISSIENVLHFFLQESGSEVILSNLMEKVANFCQNTNPIPLAKEDLSEGMAVLAVFSEDGQWYRSRIQKIDDAIQVCFVDYGNTDKVPLSQIRHVPYELLCVAPLAYPCRFNSEIGLVSGPEIEQSFQTLIGDVELIMRVLTTAQEHMEVELCKPTEPEKDIGKTLYFEIPKEIRTKLLGDVKESIFDGNTAGKLDQTDSNSSDTVYKLALPPINSTINGVASNIISIQDLYIQDNEITMDLVRLAQLTPATTDLVVAQQLAVDDMVLAKFSGDEEIYRGKIIRIEDTLVNVFFIDYGNSDSVPKTDVYEIQNVQKSFPCYALPCCLDCDLPVSEVTTEKLTEALEDKDLEVLIKAHTDTNRLVVDIRLQDNGECVLDILKELLNNDKPESDQVKPESDQDKPELEKSPKKLCKPTDTPVISNHPALPSDVATFHELDLETEDGNKFEATLTHSNNLSSFYLQKKSSEDQVNELMEKLLTHCGGTADTPPANVLPGMAVIAMLDAEGAWYRGQIVEQMEETYSVFSVDYGNIETITSDQILPIAPEFLQAPLAYPCKLYMANDKSLPDNAFDTFTYLMEDTSCQVEVMGVEDNTLEVKITVNEGDVFTQLLESSSHNP